MKARRSVQKLCKKQCRDITGHESNRDYTTFTADAQCTYLIGKGKTKSVPEEFVVNENKTFDAG